MGSIRARHLKYKESYSYVCEINIELIEIIKNLKLIIKNDLSKKEKVEHWENGYFTFLSRFQGTLNGINSIIKNNNKHDFIPTLYPLSCIIRASLLDIIYVIYLYIDFKKEDGNHIKLMNTILMDQIKHTRNNIKSLVDIGYLNDSMIEEINEKFEGLKTLDVNYNIKLATPAIIEKISNSEFKDFVALYESYIYFSKIEHFGVLSPHLTLNEENVVKHLKELNYLIQMNVKMITEIFNISSKEIDLLLSNLESKK